MNEYISETMTLEERYPFIINDLMKHIEMIKSKDKHCSLIEIIMDFSMKNGLEPELVGDAIHSDVYLKSFIHKDCQLHGMFKTENEALDVW